MAHQTPLTDEQLDALLQDLQAARGSLPADWERRQGEPFDAEAAVALYALARVERFEDLPADLESRLMATADNFSGESRRPPPPEAIALPRRVSRPQPAPRDPWWRNLGFAWGAAAFATLAAIGLAVRLLAVDPAVTLDEPIALAGGSVRSIALQPGPDGAGAQVRGEVVWDEARGTGYLKVSGLPVNDRAREQYQLWIFDGTRDDRYPVDGGVFDITAQGEARIPIRAPIPVRKAALFAVTLERAGGVVVSDRGRIVALAKAI